MCSSFFLMHQNRRKQNYYFKNKQLLIAILISILAIPSGANDVKSSDGFISAGLLFLFMSGVALSVSSPEPDLPGESFPDYHLIYKKFLPDGNPFNFSDEEINSIQKKKLEIHVNAIKKSNTSSIKKVVNNERFKYWIKLYSRNSFKDIERRKEKTIIAVCFDFTDHVKYGKLRNNLFRGCAESVAANFEKKDFFFASISNQGADSFHEQPRFPRISMPVFVLDFDELHFVRWEQGGEPGWWAITNSNDPAIKYFSSAE